MITTEADSKTLPPDRYLNRALTWLSFNGRVLEEAIDSSNALLERVRFLGIFHSNLDEFFMIRVAGLRWLLEAEAENPITETSRTRESLSNIASRAKELIQAADQAWERDLAPALREQGVRFVRSDDLEPNEREFLDRHFTNELLPILTPAAVEEELPVPRVANLQLHLAVRLVRGGEGTNGSESGADAQPERLAFVPLPRLSPRWMQVGGARVRGDGDGARFRFALLEDVVGARLGALFEGYRILEVAPFRVTRDADFATDDQEAEDLLEAVRQMLKQRMSGDPVRLEVAESASEALASRLAKAFAVEPEEIYRLAGPLEGRFFMDFARVPGLPATRAEAWPPQPDPDIPPGDALWDAIAARDRLLFHPYESFEPVLRLLRLAAEDPGVLAIKQILYRTSSTSEVVRALEQAAQNGKQVTVLLELQARFDEERNVAWARRLEDAGATVLYGLAGLKTHAKALLIVRRGPAGIERYAHVGTGNYNERTALEYSDLSLLSADDDLCSDLTAFFNVVTGYSEPLPWRRLAMAPLGLRAKFLGLIRREVERQASGEPGQIRAKMNSLLDKQIIDALYQASRAGVRVDLNVRGSCLLMPGVPGLSENIRVVTLVDRFLEHSRIFEFRNGGDTDVYIGSADWMPRNLDRRVELVVPLTNPEHRARLSRILDAIFADTVKARDFKADGTLAKRDGRRKPFRAQEFFWKEACDRVARPEESDRSAFQPRTRAPA
ncbi:MAG TPA: polyphosphate kinase 1 [Acidobacteriota bacterium]|nr:polyphosphate kinase 1 [Acidobacteriota bacterium]